MNLKKQIVAIIIGFIFVFSATKALVASQPTIFYLHETISVGTASSALGTSTINSPLYDIAHSFEAVYTYKGTGTLFYRYDGGTVTTSNGHPLSSLLKITSDKIQAARSMQFICDTIPGTVSATYMRVMP